MRFRGGSVEPPVQTVSRHWRTSGSLLASFTTLVVLASILSCADAVQIPFKDCLPASYKTSNPRVLQFSPEVAQVTFVPTNDGKNMLQFSVYGNVSGSDTTAPLPPPDSVEWRNITGALNGKIVDVKQGESTATTLDTRVDVLNYNIWSNRTRFCYDLVNGECPVAPIFGPIDRDPMNLVKVLPAFSINKVFDGTYSFAAMSATLKIRSGNENGSLLGCIAMEVTPSLGDTVSGVLRYVPMAILAMVAIATIFAAVCNPWSTVDIFLWSSNSSGGEEVLRLVTPGFADCLQYLQFVVLTGALSLNYPGFYQPAVSQFSWTALMFNKSLVSKEVGRPNVVDGVYVTFLQDDRQPFGLERLGDLVGMAKHYDIWAGAMVWLLTIIGVVVVLAAADLCIRLIVRWINKTRPGDLRQKHLPFTVGNIFRVVMLFFLLPIMTFSLFQLTEAGRSPPFVSGLAALVLIILIGTGTFVSYLVLYTKPADPLYDDLSKALCYGPFYNTYARKSASYAIIPILIVFLRAIGIGAVQKSAIAQIIILTICEVITIASLWGMTPYPRATSMNLYHGCLAFMRFVTVLLLIGFVPALSISPGIRGWLGYVILFIHALVLFVAFFLNALQTIVEILARMAGAGQENGTARGGFATVLGIRQLSRRTDKHQSHQSVGHYSSTSHDGDRKSQLSGVRPHSLSGNSTLLLAQNTPSDRGHTNARYSVNGSTSHVPGTPASRSAVSFGAIGAASQVSPETYYRRPRQKSHSGDLLISTDRRSWHSGDWSRPGGSTGASHHGSVHGSQPPVELENNYVDDWRENDPRGPPKDYTIREMDEFYRRQGSTMSGQPGRRLVTGPANPTSPVSSATGWLRNFLGGRAKAQKSKGFEVVRTGRMPPAMRPPQQVQPVPIEEPHSSEENDMVSDDDEIGGQGFRVSRTRDSGQQDPSAIELLPRQTSQRSMAPSVPRRSSKRRTASLLLSQEEASRLSAIEPSPPTSPSIQPFDPNPSTPASSRLPFFSDFDNRRASGGAESFRGARFGEPSGAAEIREVPGRLTNVGYVQQHRAGDNIYLAAENPEMGGSTAELVQERGHERSLSG